MFVLQEAVAAAASHWLGIIFCSLLLLICHRRWLHPLSAYPGPFIARFTDGYAGYCSLRQNLHLVTFRDHSRYGNVFRQGPNRLLFNSARAIQDIFLNDSVRKGAIYNQTQFHPEKNIFGTLDKAAHRRKRRIYGTLLSERSIRAFGPVMNAEIDIFIRQLLKYRNEPADMTPLCENLTTDVAGHLGFGRPLKTQTEETNRLFPKTMRSVNGMVGFYMAWPLMGYTWPILRWLTKKRNRVFSSAVLHVIKARMALPKDAMNDFWSMVAPDGKPSEELLARTEIWAEASFILPAGGTTTSAALTTVFFYLSRHADVYAKVAAEVRTQFHSADAIQIGPALAECKYLRAVIDESMRMSPPFLAAFWRDLDPSTVVDGHVVPEGTAVGISPYSVLHNENIYPHPFQFRPERWLEPEAGVKETEADARARLIARQAFVVFALGDASCLGKSLAYHEISIAIAKTFWYFDFERAPGEAGKLGEGEPGRTDGRHRKEEFQLFDVATADHAGPNLVFRTRGQYWKELDTANSNA